MESKEIRDVTTAAVGEADAVGVGDADDGVGVEGVLLPFALVEGGAQGLDLLARLPVPVRVPRHRRDQVGGVDGLRRGFLGDQRVSTNVLTPEGKRGVGTQLARNAVWRRDSESGTAEGGVGRSGGTEQAHGNGVSDPGRIAANVVSGVGFLGAPLAQHADVVLTARCKMDSFVESFTAPLSLINAIVTAVGLCSKEATLNGLKRLEELWRTQNVYCDNENGHGARPRAT